VELRYTLDGSEPDSAHSAIFKEGIRLTESAPVKVRAFKQGWQGSDVAEFNFFQSKYKPDSIRLLFPLNRVQQAEGADTFFDHKLGVIGANNPAWANNWGGVRDNDLGLYAEFHSPVAVSRLGLHYMIEEDTGIFPPEVIEVWGGVSPDQMKLLSKFKAAMPAKGDKPVLKTAETSFKTERVTCLKIMARPVNAIPDWHKSKGKRALLLVDEVFVN
ncbi:MAG TPA: FN3 associated domain-containing protein, partial [Dyadobacter sp.]|nr:FN3 associated domain-containing protein [Dyadobacter sp.]